EYLGRIDEQVKIRGYRVELKEIEEVLRNQEGIKNSVAIIKDVSDKDKAILSYVVMEEGKELNISEIKEELREELPEYMIPHYFKAIDKVPLTANGKVDKKALPEIEYVREDEYVAPTTDVEKILCEIFEEVLGVKQVGIKDNFFELGGDSIKSIRVVSKARELGYEISVRDIMLLHCVESLAREIKEITIQYEQGEINGELDLTPIQKTFINWNLANRNHYNQTVILESKKTLSETALRETLDALVKTHDILRVVFKENHQVILPMNESKKYTLKILDSSNWTNLEDRIEEECTKIQRTMDLENGPLMKIALFKTNKCDYLMISIHHFVVDGVSWRILLEDLLLGYNLAEENKEIVLPDKTASYKQWSKMLDAYSTSFKFQKESKYWEDIYSHIDNTQIPREINLSKGNYNYERLEIDSNITHKLIYESLEAYNMNVNDILLTSLMLAIKNWKGMDGITVDLESHGRNDMNENIHLDRTLGWFTSIYPIYLQSYDTLKENLVETKEMLRRVPNLGIGYALWKYRKLDARKSIPSIIFNYMGDMNLNIKEESTFNMSSISAGLTIAEGNELPHDISIDMQLNNGKLYGYVNYKEGKFTRDSIRNLCNSYIESLIGIIEHCCSKEEAVATLSDFGASDMEAQELEDIMDIFG
ncbi:condensation domain-containing protein, partial [Senegalia sp. (in: firmicutes)]|uniref:condensation domain-containing protein n=1 Tax=Senegalia sp. (in: firmicutes) TaxID=1924098 RepID=UPI003F950F87